MGYMNNPEMSVPNPNRLLHTLKRNLPKILAGAAFLVSASGCVFNPQAGDVLVADTTVNTAYCKILPGTKITLGDSRVVDIGANQQDTVWGALVPECGAQTLPNTTVMFNFSRVPNKP